MLDTFDDRPQLTASAQAQRARLTWTLWFLALLGLSGMIGLSMLRTGLPASPSAIGWLIYLLGAALIFKEPRYGVYLIMCFGLMGDNVLDPWFPFIKNFSSGESLLYLNDALIFSPLELYIVLTYVAWLGRMALRRKWAFYAGELTGTAVIFTGFVTFGLVYGLGTGGVLNIALWEARPIYYIIAMLVLVSNLFNKREHYSHLMWFIAFALFIEGLFGLRFYIVEIEMDLTRMQSITEHSAAMHMNTLFVLIAAVWLYKGCSPTKRLLLPLLAPPVLLTYVATQRRASFLTLGVAIALMAIILLKENRRAFWLIMPPAGVFALMYIAVFWNASGPLAMPVKAIKSVVAEDEADAADQASNEYRLIENLNSDYTIHQEPLTGVGFGKKFYLAYPMPDISFFEWWEYITHNSIIWFWMKTGTGGFLTMVFFVALAIITGVRAVWRLPGGDVSAIALTAVLYIIMHYIYAYVDMSWDNQSMIYIGTMMGIINSIEHVASHPVPLPRKRWPWQPDPQPAGGLVAIPKKWTFWTERD
ncbi:MAG: O-antigen ligase family protein [Anaerolineales bacterium]|nr:O-antigen ligase family protein [Anaerolineales bacterium]MCB8983679.1 O-antigen ligase family protein [Ardenticatenaceae bacterium]